MTVLNMKPTPERFLLSRPEEGIACSICHEVALLGRTSSWETTTGRKTQLQDASSKLVNEILFHPSSELFTGCPSKHVSSISCHLCHSFFSDTVHVYTSGLLRVFSPPRQLRFYSDSRTLRIRHTKTKTCGHRPFHYAAPFLLNSLSREIRHLQSTTAF